MREKAGEVRRARNRQARRWGQRCAAAVVVVVILLLASRGIDRHCAALVRQTFVHTVPSLFFRSVTLDVAGIVSTDLRRHM